MPARPAMPVPLRRPMGFVAALAALVVLGLGALYAAGASLGDFDGRALPLHGLRRPWWDIALVIDFGAEPVGAAVLLTLLVAVCLALRRPRMAVLAVAGSGLTIALTTLLKPLVGRTIHGDHLSYPSGHTATMTALALVVALLVADLRRTGRRAGMLLVLALAGAAGAAMAWSQTILSAHYATDTIGGFAAALAVVPPTAWLLDRVADRFRAWRAGSRRTGGPARRAERARSTPA